MGNIFMNKTKKHKDFSWDQIGDIQEGRQELGVDMPVALYRLLEYSVNSVLVKEFGQEGSDRIFRAAGELAGREFAKNMLDLSLDFNGFVAQLQKILKDLKVGILKMESFNEEDGSFVLTVGEDLDCSGLPVTDEVVCNYDEGFLRGVLGEYTHKEYKVREIDCWASGDRVCRFKGEVETQVL